MIYYCSRQEVEEAQHQAVYLLLFVDMSTGLLMLVVYVLLLSTYRYRYPHQSSLHT